MGVPAGLVSRIAGAITKKIEGFLKVHELRSKSGRSMVKAFNKEKHMLLAFPRDGPSGHGILLPTARIKAATKIHAEIFTIDGVEIRPSPGYIRNRAKRAMEAQAILWDTLSLILQTRYRTVAPTPDWVESTLDTWGD